MHGSPQIVARLTCSGENDGYFVSPPNSYLFLNCCFALSQFRGFLVVLLCKPRALFPRVDNVVPHGGPRVRQSLKLLLGSLLSATQHHSRQRLPNLVTTIQLFWYAATTKK